MHIRTWSGLVLFTVVAWIGLWAGDAPNTAHAKKVGSPYLLVWAGDGQHKQPDFMAVLDVDPASKTYGQVVRRVPVNGSGMMPHHTEYEFPAGGMLFANGWAAGHTFVIDARQAASLKVKTDFVQAGRTASCACPTGTSWGPSSRTAAGTRLRVDWWNWTTAGR